MQHSQNCQKCLLEVEAAMRSLGELVDPAKALERAAYMKSGMPLLGLTVPQQRKRLKQGYSFSNLSFEDQVPLWSYIWNEAPLHEVKMQAAFFVERPPAHVDPVWLWDRLESWVGSVNCWDQSDTLSDVLSALHEKAPDHAQPCLERWNDSDNPWERRQSLVALIFYSRLRRFFPDPELVFRLVENRLSDPDYYVQKGVGWTLREAYHVWPQDALAFLDAHIAVLAPAAWQAATEKLDRSVKQALKQKRKAGGTRALKLNGQGAS